LVSLRTSIIILLIFPSGVRNDLKDITKKIEEALHELHAEAREGLGLNVSSQSHAEDISNEDFPFARVRDVISGSPADKAVSFYFEFQSLIS